MMATFERLEDIVREADTREHLARYRALEQQMEAEHERAAAERSRLMSIIFAILLAAALAALAWYWRQKRIVTEKNRALARQIDEAMKYKDKYQSLVMEKRAEPANTTDASCTDEQLFQHVNDVIVRERLFLDFKFSRQAIMQRFQLSKDRVGAIFTRSSQYANLTDYIQELRLEYSAQLLSEHRDISISQIAQQSGFSSYSYYCKCFRQRFGMTPSEFRALSK